MSCVSRKRSISKLKSDNWNYFVTDICNLIEFKECYQLEWSSQLIQITVVTHCDTIRDGNYAVVMSWTWKL